MSRVRKISLRMKQKLVQVTNLSPCRWKKVNIVKFMPGDDLGMGCGGGIRNMCEAATVTMRSAKNYLI